MLEAVQRFFTARIVGVNSENYWERLKTLHIYSLERRKERFIIIQVWKILEGHVVNITGANAIQSLQNNRRGRSFKIPLVVGTSGLTGRLRNLTGICPLLLKRTLDKYLSIIPDEPGVPGTTAH